MEQLNLSQEIKDYILRLHWARYPFSAIAFKVQTQYTLPLTREILDSLVMEDLSKRASAKAWDSPISS